MDALTKDIRYAVRGLLKRPGFIDTAKVTSQFFSVLGTQPLRGRSFLVKEDQPGRDQVAILSYALWQRRFGGDSNVLGRNLTLDGHGYTVVGVMPADFQFPDPEIQGPDTEAKTQLFMPHTQPVLGNLMLQSLSVVLRTDGNPEGAIAGVGAIVRELDPRHE